MSSKADKQQKSYDKLCERIKKTADGLGNGHKVSDRQIRQEAQRIAEKVDRDRSNKNDR